MNGLGDKVFQVAWTGAKYAVTDKLDVIAAYYQYIQDSFFGTAARGPAPCSGAEHSQCAGTFYAISAAVDWKFSPKWDLYAGFMFSQVNSALANNFFSATTSIPRSDCASASEDERPPPDLGIPREFGSSSRSPRGIAPTFVARTRPIETGLVGWAQRSVLMHSINAVGGDYVRIGSPARDGHRWNFSEADKRRIVEEAGQPGTVVDVAKL